MSEQLLPPCVYRGRSNQESQTCVCNCRQLVTATSEVSFSTCNGEPWGKSVCPYALPVYPPDKRPQTHGKALGKPVNRRKANPRPIPPEPPTDAVERPTTGSWRWGDNVKSALDKVGVTEERISEWLGKPCGCSQRRAKLNSLSQWAQRVLTGKGQPAEEIEELLEE